MAFATFYVVTIQFADAAPFMGKPQPGMMPTTRNIRVVESGKESSHAFSLKEGDGPEYTLNVGETMQLDQLLGQIDVRVPWKSMAGFDGTTCELTLHGAMSSLSFNWWVEAPEAWVGVGAVFDYVLEVADGARPGEG